MKLFQEGIFILYLIIPHEDL